MAISLLVECWDCFWFTVPCQAILLSSANGYGLRRIDFCDQLRSRIALCRLVNAIKQAQIGAKRYSPDQKVGSA
jgi:hypothetical protein